LAGHHVALLSSVAMRVVAFALAILDAVVKMYQEE
jgi:hypothetical protein